MQSLLSANFSRFPFLVPVLALACFYSSTYADDPDHRKLFMNKQRAAHIEITQASAPEQLTHLMGTRLQRFGVTVKILDQLPPSAFPREQGVEVVHVRLPYFGGPVIGVQQWFPVQVGSRLVVAFTGETLPSAEFLTTIGTSTVASEVNWRDCASFYSAVRNPKMDATAELTKALRGESHVPGQAFYQLVDSFDRQVFGESGFALATAKNLQNPRLPLMARIEMTGLLGHQTKRSPEANRGLASALIALILEAKKAGGVSPGNVLLLLSTQFVYRSPPEALPQLEASQRRSLLELATDKQVVHDQGCITPLVGWLQGKDHSTLPPTSKEALERELGGRAKPAPEPASVAPPVADPQPSEAPRSWTLVFWLLGCFLVVLLCSIGVLRISRRKRKPSS